VFLHLIISQYSTYSTENTPLKLKMESNGAISLTEEFHFVGEISLIPFIIKMDLTHK